MLVAPRCPPPGLPKRTRILTAPPTQMPSRARMLIPRELPQPKTRKFGDKKTASLWASGAQRTDPTGESSWSSGGSTSDASDGNVGRQRKLVARRRNRWRRWHQKAEESRRRGASLLEENAVTPRTLEGYRQELRSFRRASGIDAARAESEELDAALVLHLETLFFEGWDPSRGVRLMAAVLHFQPKFGRGGERALPRGWRSLRGWRRLCPPRSRAPECLEVWGVIINGLVRDVSVDMGVFVALSISTYARPSALLALQANWMVRPDLGPHWALLLNPPEGHRPTKTGEWDQSVLLDSSWLTWLGPALERLKANGQPGRPVWHFDYPDYLASFRHVAKAEGMADLTPYQTRHSGASIDRFNNWRSLADVKKRGGWRSDKSVARYEKAARLGVQKEKRGDAIVGHGKRCLRALEDILLRGRTLRSRLSAGTR